MKENLESIVNGKEEWKNRNKETHTPNMAGVIPKQFDTSR